MATPVTLTAAQLPDLPPPDPRVGKHYELSDGELIIVPNAKRPHERCKFKVNWFLCRWADPEVGEVYSETQFSLSEDRARVPDVAFVRRDLLDATSEHDDFPFGPDLAVEIVSDSERSQDVEQKVREYFAAGTREVWQMYPRLKMVRVQTPGSIHDLEGEDVIESPVLPGFRVPIAEFFR